MKSLTDLSKEYISNRKHHKLKTYIEDNYYDELIQTTSFLNSYNVSLDERIYCVAYNIDFIIECPYCKNKAIFNNKEKKYEPLCGHIECKSSSVNITNDMRMSYNIKNSIADYYIMIAKRDNEYNNKKINFKYDIIEEFNEYIPIIKSFVFKEDGKYNPFYKKNISSNIPDFIRKVNDKFSIYYLQEIIYCCCFNISMIPECPVCGKALKLKDFHTGFRQYCSRECHDDTQRKNGEIQRKKHKEQIFKGILDSCKELSFEYNGRIYNYYSLGKSEIMIQDYNCTHHKDLIMRRTILNYIQIYSYGSELCIKCNIEKNYNNYQPSDEDINKFLDVFDEFYEYNSHKMKDDWWMRYYPREKKIIDVYFEQICPSGYSSNNNAEKIYAFKNKLSKLPICVKCNKVCTFKNIIAGYNYTCKEHSGQYIPIKKYNDE